MRFVSTITTLASIASLSNALTSTLQQVTGFNVGPTSAGMYVYIPTTRVAKPPIILAIHYCTGTAQAYFSGTPYAQYADTYGYIVIYPNSANSGACWDVASTASLTHNGGGDSKTIANMVSYAVANYGADPNRVFATGTSSGAMMTNVLAGAYPDIIKAGSAYSGVPDGCFYVAGATPATNPPGWNNQCSGGTLVKTAQQWGDQVRGYYPGYTGSYPKMALWHGTADTVLSYPNLAEALKQWSNVHGLSFTRNNTNTPEAKYTQIVYGDGTKVIGFSGQDVGHSVPVHIAFDLAWFGITGGSSTSSSSTSLATSSTSRISTSSMTTTVRTTTTTVRTTTTTTTTTLRTTTTTTAASGGSIPKWGQCAGQGWTGSGTCAAGSTCIYSNPWYSQCL